MNRPESGFRKGMLLGVCFILCVSTFAAEAPFGWRIGPTAWSFNRFSFFEAVDKTASIGMSYIEAFQGQQLRPDSPLTLDVDLPDETLQEIHAKLDAAKVKLVSIYIHNIPGDEAECRRIFEFARKLGIGILISEPAPESFDVIEACCDEYDIRLALHNHPKGSSRYWNPETVRAACEGRGPRIGACADTGHWLRSGLNPADALRTLGNRLLTLHLKDLDKMGPDARDVPWGQGCGGMEEVLRTVYDLRINPVLFGIEYESDWDNNLVQLRECGAWFQQTAAALGAAELRENPLSVGWASGDITPQKPVALAGQYNKRLMKSVRDPLTVTALALETTGPNGKSEQAVIVSCDLVGISQVETERIREAVAARAPGLDPRKILVSATHTHTAPVTSDTRYKKVYEVGNEPGEMLPSEYCNFFIERTADTIAEAWKNRAPGGVSWALVPAMVGINRRARYGDGSAVMYGNTSLDHFESFEGSTDPGIEMLFFWRPDKTLSGVILNLACPSQETESLFEASADFWHDVRQEIRARHDPNLFILPQCSAAGDISPHRMFQKEADRIMLERAGLSHRQVIGRRIANAFDEARLTADADIKFALPLKHDLVDLDLPEVDPPRPGFAETDSVHPIRFHVLRIGDVAMASNPFELYLDYGFRIKARSRPVLTFLVQLADGTCGYLPTAEAVSGGGYSAEDFTVGPEGGQVLVEQTVRRINYLFE